MWTMRNPLVEQFFLQHRISLSQIGVNHRTYFERNYSCARIHRRFVTFYKYVRVGTVHTIQYTVMRIMDVKTVLFSIFNFVSKIMKAMQSRVQ